MSRIKRVILEVHRRSLWQVLLIYVGCSWACYELVDTITSRFGLPEWLPALAAILFLVGLPFVVATAFIRDESAPVVADAQADRASHQPAGGRRPMWRRAGLIFLVACAAWGFVATGWLLLGEGTKPSPERELLVVLPFQNLGATEDGYFADGLTDAMNARLAAIQGLGIISRQSAIQYKGSEKTAREIGAELGVDYILEGTVQRERPGDPASRLRVIPQLIRISDDTHLWAETYDEDGTELFRIQTAIAERTAQALEITLLDRERTIIEGRPTESLEAYELYLSALDVPYAGAASYDKQIRLLERAIELDSGFAMAYATLSLTSTEVFHQGVDRSSQRLAAAKRAADRALELDPELAEAHAALAEYYYFCLGDLERAVDYSREAVRLNPSNTDALWLIAGQLLREGRAREAVATYLKVLSLDPRNYIRAANAAARFHYLRDYETAERYFDRAIDLMPADNTARKWKSLLYLSWTGDTAKARAALPPKDCGGLTYVIYDATWRLCSDALYALDLSKKRERLASEGRLSSLEAAQYFILKAWLHGRGSEVDAEHAAYDSAQAILEVLVRDLPEDSRLRSGLGIAYAGLGRREAAIREGRLGVELAPPDPLVHTTDRVLNLARIYMMVGELDRATDQLAILLPSDGRVTTAWLRSDPLWDPLRDHLPFQALLEEYE